MQVETQNNLASQNQPPVPLEQGSDLTPLNLIRTETVLSKFPRHILSKSGQRPEIRIEKLTAGGKLEMRWYVSYNELYGPARQLAYDLDTLIIDRAIEETFEEARRSAQELPRLIPIGSLRDICRKLNFEENGSNTSKIKKALQQNAGTVINAILSYRGNDGSEQTIDGTFTCYGVFFIGKKLPDGRKADQTYVSTTNEYHQVISTSPTRPLDYDYKAQLPPTPRRWYELASFAMYGALKNNQPTAKLLYSDYCDRAPHVRYPTFDQVKKQMYKVHRPHLLSGYITKVSYDQLTDQQGRLDWIMHYVPGPKARSDYAAITGKKLWPSLDQKIGAGETRYRPRQRHLNLKPASEPQPTQTVIDYRLVAEMSKRGISETDARAILANLPTDQAILDQLEWGDFQISQSRGKITNPAGFYISLLQRNVTPPPTFETSAARNARQQAELARHQALQQETRAQLAADAAIEAELDQLQTTQPERYQALYSQAQKELIAAHPKVGDFLRRHPGSSLHDGAIRARIKNVMAAEPALAGPPIVLSLEAILATPQLPAPSHQATASPATQTGSPSVDAVHAHPRTTDKPVD